MKNLILIVVALLCFACDKKSDQDKLSDETIDAIAGRWHSARYAEDENFTVKVKPTDKGQACFAGTTLEFKKNGTYTDIRPCDDTIVNGKFWIEERDPVYLNSIYIKLRRQKDDGSSSDIALTSTGTTTGLRLYKYTESTLIFYSYRTSSPSLYYEFKRVQ